jgi:hypothetical protein
MQTSQISKLAIHVGEEVKGIEIRDEIFQFIQSLHSDFNTESYMSISELNQFRRQYLTTLISQEKGELARLDRDVMQAIATNSILSENIQEEIEAELTFGQHIADKVASFGGSWTFIITFFSFILICF